MFRLTANLETCSTYIFLLKIIFNEDQPVKMINSFNLNPQNPY